MRINLAQFVIVTRERIYGLMLEGERRMPCSPRCRA